MCLAAYVDCRAIDTNCDHSVSETSPIAQMSCAPLILRNSSTITCPLALRNRLGMYEEFGIRPNVGMYMSATSFSPSEKTSSCRLSDVLVDFMTFVCNFMCTFNFWSSLMLYFKTLGELSSRIVAPLAT